MWKRSTRKRSSQSVDHGRVRRVLETYRGIPHLLDTWLVLTGMALPVVLSSLRWRGIWSLG